MHTSLRPSRLMYASFINVYHLLQDEVSSLCTRYGLTMLKKIRNGSVHPGTNGSASDSLEHDSPVMEHSHWAIGGPQSRYE